MNVSLNWLGEYVDVAGKSVKELDDLLTFAGIEIEGIHPKGVSSDRIVVAQIKEAVQHPNADRLKVCQVDAGEGTLRQIVCGAKNYQVGDKVPCALPGATLPAGFTIGETKMRGVESKGMLCAASEIGLVDQADGLLILEGDPQVGTPLQKLFGSDVLLEVEVTPNRPDLLSHQGLAFELAALLKKEVKRPAFASLTEKKNTAEILLEHDDCPFYTLTKITGVTVKESPAWLQERLLAIGLRPINNVVDITNFVLHEMGQPLHAFDAAKVKGKIHVRSAKSAEVFSALNGSDYHLQKNDIVISDDSGAALALAGVMGGAESGVTESTTDVLLESAYFSPSNVRYTSRYHALMSDSSYRFERGVNPQNILAAAARATALICEIAGGKVTGDAEIAGELPILTGKVELDLTKLDQLMGASISHDDAAEILTRLGLKNQGENQWLVPPSRADLQRHIDLVEEIARVHGLENVPARMRTTIVSPSDADAAYDTDMNVRRALAALGFHEAQTIKLIAENQLRDALPLRPLTNGDVVKVSHPLSEDHAVMRPSVLPGIIATAERNLRQGAKALRFFELGKVFRHSGGGKARDQEADVLGILVSGSLAPQTWSNKSTDATVYDLKAALSVIVGGNEIVFTPREREGFALACDVSVDGQNIGVAARLKPSREREMDAASAVWIAEIDVAKLRKLRMKKVIFAELPQFPGSSRDAAMEVPLHMPAATLDQAIRKASEPLLVEFSCFDVFTDATGQKIAADKKSVAYRFLYRDAARTLKSEEVDAAHKKLLEHLMKTAGVVFR